MNRVKGLQPDEQVLDCSDRAYIMRDSGWIRIERNWRRYNRSLRGSIPLVYREHRKQGVSGKTARRQWKRELRGGR